MKDKIKWKNLIVLLVIITVLIIGYIYIYTNYISIKDKNIYPQENDPDALIFEAKDLILNDNVDLRTNFSNKKLEYNKIPYEMECIYFDTNLPSNSKAYACRQVEISIFNNTIISSTDLNSTSEKHYFILKDNYFIHQYVGNNDDGCGYITITKDNNPMFYRENVITSSVTPDSAEINIMKLKNNLLYYYVIYNEKISLRTININNESIIEKEIKKYETNKKISCSNN